MRTAETVLGVIQERLGMRLLESHVRPKDSRVVRRGVDGKVPSVLWIPGNSLASYPTTTVTRTTVFGWCWRPRFSAFQKAGIAWRLGQWLPGRGLNLLDRGLDLLVRDRKNGGAGSWPRPERGRHAHSYRTGRIATAPRPGFRPWRGATGGNRALQFSPKTLKPQSRGGAMQRYVVSATVFRPQDVLGLPRA